MDSVRDQVQIIGMLAAHEASVAELYEALAARFPERGDFFRGLARAEVRHARAVAEFAKKVAAGLVQVSPGRLDSWAILTSLDDLRERLAQAQDISLPDALSMCLEVEESLIERMYFETLATDSDELQNLLRVLADDTGTHRDRVREACEREGQLGC